MVESEKRPMTRTTATATALLMLLAALALCLYNTAWQDYQRLQRLERCYIQVVKHGVIFERQVPETVVVHDRKEARKK